MIGSPISCRFTETYSEIDDMHKNYLKAFPFYLDLFFFLLRTTPPFLFFSGLLLHFFLLRTTPTSAPTLKH